MAITLHSFSVVGISTVTSNTNSELTSLIDKLWQTFYKQDISSKIPNKCSEDVYAIYTDYESDYKGQYTLIIGHKVDDLRSIPTDLVGRMFAGGKYEQFSIKGKIPDVVIKAWTNIWENDKSLNRRYTADIEVYDAKSTHQDNAQIDIYIAVK